MPKQGLSWYILDVMRIDGSGGEFFGDSGVDGRSEHVESHAVDDADIIHAILQRFDTVGGSPRLGTDRRLRVFNGETQFGSGTLVHWRRRHTVRGLWPFL